MVSKIAAAALCLAAVSGVHAQESFYAGGLVSQFQIKDEDGTEVKPTTIALKLGSVINKNFAVEARLGGGASDDSFDNGGIEATVKVKNFAGIYAKGILPLTDMVSAYGLLGYTRVKFSVEQIGSSGDISQKDVSYGIGADFALANNMSLGLEWAELLNKEGTKIRGLSLSAAYKF